MTRKKRYHSSEFKREALLMLANAVSTIISRQLSAAVSTSPLHRLSPPEPLRALLTERTAKVFAKIGVALL